MTDADLMKKAVRYTQGRQQKPTKPKQKKPKASKPKKP